MNDAQDIASLLEPIPGERPTGRDVRYEGDYDKIAEARRDENAQQQFGVWTRDIKSADWPLVERLCRAALMSKTKDLRIACSLAEAWVAQRGFPGLAPALTLIDSLCERYWGQLQPLLDGDVEGHIAAIDSLNHRLAIVLYQIPVVQQAATSDDTYNWADYVNAQQLEQARLQDAKAALRSEAGGAVTLALFEACRDRTDSGMLTGIARDLAAALAAYAALDATLDTCCGRDAPGLGRSRNVVIEIADFAHDVLSTRHATASAVASPTIAASPLQPVPPAPLPPAPLSRDAAYQQLHAIARQLHVLEPHSPVPHVLDHLAAWGALPLPQLEAELRSAGSGMSLLLEVLGLRPSDE